MQFDVSVDPEEILAELRTGGRSTWDSWTQEAQAQR